MITVRWSAAHEDDNGMEHPFVEACDTLLPPWADCEANAESAVGDIIEDWFKMEAWEEMYGAGEDCATVIVKVAAPPSIAGRYTVDIERTLKARARRDRKPEAI
jgi:hypothetical protein